jgi:hypothetical protein
MLLRNETHIQTGDILAEILPDLANEHSSLTEAIAHIDNLQMLPELSGLLAGKFYLNHRS